MKLDDYINSEAFAEDPFPFYRILRKEDPVHWCEYYGAWVLTRYDDIRKCLSDTETFSSQGRAISHFSTLFTPPEIENLTLLRQQFMEGLISSDPPDHTRLKRVMLKGIRPMNDDRLKDVVFNLVNDLLSTARNRGKIDAIADFAYPLPIYVTLDVLGVPQSKRDSLKSACEKFLSLSRDPRPSFEIALQSQDGLLEIRTEFARILESRRSQPKRDFISNLAEAEKQGVLKESEILTTLVTVLIGGHETTTYLLGSALWILKQYPEQFRLLQNDPSILPVATEEFIRFVGPFQYLKRVTTRDIKIRGRSIKKGDLVLAHLRKPNRHLGFGHGPHACLGAPFARSEVPIALELFFRLIPDYTIEAKEIKFPMHSLRGPDKLLIRL